MITALRRALAPRPVMSTRRLVALATIALCEPPATEPVSHRRHPRTRPLVVGERS